MSVLYYRCTIEQGASLSVFTDGVTITTKKIALGDFLYAKLSTTVNDGLRDSHYLG